MESLKEIMLKYKEADSSFPMPSDRILKKVAEISKDSDYIVSLFLDLINNSYESWEDFHFDELEYSASIGENELLLYFGGLFFIADQYQKAEEIFNELLDRGVEDSRVYKFLAFIYDIYGNNQKAIEFYEKLIKENDYFLDLGRLYKNIKKYYKAIFYYELEIKRDKNSYYAHLSLADIYRDLNLYKRAIKHNKIAVNINLKRDLDKKNYILYNKIAGFYHKLGDDKKAIKYFKRAVEVDSKNHIAYYNLGVVYAKISCKKAIGWYKRAIELNGKNVYYNLGNSYLNCKKYKEAIKSFKEHLNLEGEDDRVYVNMGVAYSHIKKKKEELRCYRRALEINPKNYQAYINIFDIYVNRRKYPPKEITEKFLKNFKNHKDIYLIYLIHKYRVDIYHKKEIDLTIFEQEFKDRGLSCCKFNKSEFLKNAKKREKKILKKLLKVLKKHTRSIEKD